MKLLRDFHEQGEHRLNHHELVMINHSLWLVGWWPLSRNVWKWYVEVKRKWEDLWDHKLKMLCLQKIARMDADEMDARRNGNM